MTAGGMALPGRARPPADSGTQSANLADILERVLDKGIVIAGDIRVNLLDIELLTIKIRLLVASVDKAREIGIDWWEHDPSLSSGGARPGRGEPAAPRARIARWRPGADPRDRDGKQGASGRRPRIRNREGAGDG